jgi:hypothetical protein
MPESHEHRRTTFLNAGQLIERCIEACSEIATELDRWARGWSGDERAYLLMTVLLKHQLELKTHLQAYLRDAPDKVLATRSQYVVELDIGDDWFPEDPQAALRRVLDWNAEIERCFDEQQANILVPEVSEAYAGLRDTVRQTMRRMSSDAAGSADL